MVVSFAAFLSCRNSGKTRADNSGYEVETDAYNSEWDYGIYQKIEQLIRTDAPVEASALFETLGT